MSGLTKRLQAIEQPLWILKEKDNELYKEIQKEKYNGFIELFNLYGAWKLIDGPEWSPCSTYRLSPEYKEPETGQYKEPEKAGHCLEFPVELGSEGNGYVASTPYGWSNYHELPSVKGFSGVQFEGQTSKIWYTVLNKYIDEDGILCEVATLQNLQNGELKPAVPVRVLFWVEGE